MSDLDHSGESSGSNSLYDGDESKSESYDWTETWLKTVVCFSILLVILGTPGNFWVCLSVVRKKKMRTPINIFLMSIAIADICFSIFYIVMFESILAITKKWIFGDAMLFILKFIRPMSEFLTATIIAVPFVIAIFFQEMRIRSCLIITAFLWTVAASYGIYFGYIGTLVDDPYNGIAYDPSNNVVAWLRITLAFFKIPAPLLIVAFSVILHKVWKKKFLSEGPTSRMMLTVVLVFALYNMVSVLSAIIVMHSGAHFKLRIAIIFVNHFLALVGLIYKPLIYVLFDSDWKEQFKGLSPCCASKRTVQAYSLCRTDNKL